MKTSSAKAKGRRASLETIELLRKYCPDLREDDIRAASSGSNGPDVLLSPAAQDLLPLVIENKCQESLNIWAAYAQAESHRAEGSTLAPTVFFRRNRSKLMVCLSAEDFIRLIR